jgi:hypothetical protein
VSIGGDVTQRVVSVSCLGVRTEPGPDTLDLLEVDGIVGNVVSVWPIGNVVSLANVQSLIISLAVAGMVAHGLHANRLTLGYHIGRIIGGFFFGIDLAEFVARFGDTVHSSQGSGRAAHLRRNSTADKTRVGLSIRLPSVCI